MVGKYGFHREKHMQLNTGCIPTCPTIVDLDPVTSSA